MDINEYHALGYKKQMELAKIYSYAFDEFIRSKLKLGQYKTKEVMDKLSEEFEGLYTGPGVMRRIYFQEDLEDGFEEE